MANADYSVNYNISVQSQSAVTALKAFEKSVNSAVKKQTELDQLATKIQKLNDTFAKTHELRIKTKTANQNLRETLKLVQQIENRMRNIYAMGYHLSTRGGGAPLPANPSMPGKANKNSGSSAKQPKQPRQTGQTKQPKQPSQPKTGIQKFLGKNKGLITAGNTGYKFLGPSMLDSGGVGVFDMVKGMGMAYGLMAVGGGMANIIKSSAEYNNLMQTTRGILKSHDTREDFNAQFAKMQQTVRTVGLQTKFTAPEVADAAKFLAMAGIDVEGIQHAIQPIADIALVGDTELGNTADVVTNIMTSYGISPLQIRKAADIMVNSFTEANITLEEMAQAYKYAGGLLHAGGVTFEESTAALGILGDAGIKGSQAGTTMRTIIGNLVNPTKKQLGAWDAIGVSRFTSSGQLRNLADIFSDLNERNISVDYFYRLFHKTAAQGAVALTNNVDKWEQMIADNMASMGMSSMLAQAKKNTISGLWAQVESMFTEQGLRSFESLDSRIRAMLQGLLEWIGSDEGKDTIHTLFAMLIDLGKAFKDFTVVILKMADDFSGVIKLWLKFQMNMWPVLSVLRIFRSLLMPGAYLAIYASRILSIASAVGKLSSAVASYKAIGVAAMAMVKDFYYTSIAPAEAQQAQSAANGTAVAGGTAVNGAVSGKTVLKGVAGMALGATGGYLAGSSIATALGGDELTQIYAGIGGMALGSALMPVIVGSGPIGWAAAGAVALTAAIASYSMEIDRADAAFKNYLATTQVVNGTVITNSSILNGYYEDIIENEKKVTSEIDARIQKRIRERQIIDPNYTPPNISSIDGKHAEDVYTLLDDKDSFFDSIGMNKSAIDIINNLRPGSAFGKYGGSTFSSNAIIDVWTGEKRKVNNPKGVRDAADVMGAYALVASMAASSPELQQYIADTNNDIRKALFSKDADVLLAKIRNRIWGDYVATGQSYDAATTPENWSASPRFIKEGKYDKGDIGYIKSTYAWQNTTANAYLQAFLGDNGVLTQLRTFQEQARTNTLTPQTIYDAVLATTGENDPLHQALQTLGGVIDGMTGDAENVLARYGIIKGVVEATTENTAFQNAQIIFRDFDAMLSAMKLITVGNATEALSNFNSMLMILKNVSLTVPNQSIPAEVDASNTGYHASNPSEFTKNWNGQNYLWESDSQGNYYWFPTDKSGKRIANTVGLTDKQANVLDYRTKNGGSFAGERNPGGSQGNQGNQSNSGNQSSSSLGSDKNRYKNQYHSSATPKQINISIGTLLEVKNIDMSKPDNSAAVDTVKQVLANALADVVAEYASSEAQRV